MADRIDYAVSVTAIEDGTLTPDYSTGHPLDGTESAQDADFVNINIGRSLGGGKSDTTWAGTAPAGWTAGAHVHKTSQGGTIATGATCDGLWVKHTGFAYDAGVTSKKGSTAETTTKVTLTGTNDVICVLSAGQAVFLPAPPNQTVTLSDDGTDVAVEYAILT
jgi:hypothetical protein